MSVSQLNTADIKERLERMMYSITVVAFNESGRDKKNLLFIRDEISSLLKKQELSRNEIVKELGVILIGLAILSSTARRKSTKDTLSKIIDEFYATN